MIYIFSSPREFFAWSFRNESELRLEFCCLPREAIQRARLIAVKVDDGFFVLKDRNSGYSGATVESTTLKQIVVCDMCGFYDAEEGETIVNYFPHRDQKRSTHIERLPGGTNLEDEEL